uniref:Immunoglobulin V-set domain-containing protein n=1 Tax=Gasterosteus aculeatus aculeatus TaxID=481459 RepID=A0AAQ4NQK0_GASAC
LTELSLLLGFSCEELTPAESEENSVEDTTVTMSYNYYQAATYSDYFFWYRQHPGKPPEFLIVHSGTQHETSSRLSAEVSDDKTRIDLKISSATVSDSAVYYCAVRPTVTGSTKTLYKNLCSKDNSVHHPPEGVSI